VAYLGKYMSGKVSGLIAATKVARANRASFRTIDERGTEHEPGDLDQGSRVGAWLPPQGRAGR
jgi:hypothetical protein